MHAIYRLLCTEELVILESVEIKLLNRRYRGVDGAKTLEALISYWALDPHVSIVPRTFRDRYLRLKECAIIRASIRSLQACTQSLMLNACELIDPLRIPTSIGLIMFVNIDHIVSKSLICVTL